jgi:hypothetical protein
MSELQNFRSKYGTHKALIENLYIIALTDTYYRIQEIESIWNYTENEIRNEIQKDFKYNNTLISDYINNETITFNSESQTISKQSNIVRTDIKLFCAFFRKSFVIECKKFNPYNNDYIHGHYNSQKQIYEYNGIERFTERKYAENDKYAGMIGFICSGKIENIVKNLKSKVEQFNLSNNSKKLLSKKCVDWKHSFQSKHIRNDKSEIQIYHLFIDLRNKRTQKIEKMLN